MAFFLHKLKSLSETIVDRQFWWNLLVNGVLMSYIVPLSFRRFILNCIGVKVKGVVHGHCTILTRKLFLAEGSFINRNCFIDNNALIEIGCNCSVGYNVVFITSNHSMNSSDKRGGQLKPLPIVIKDGCWIGANVTILPGTIIEEGCVIAAGSVVKGVCKINCLYAGVPAKKIKDLESC